MKDMRSESGKGSMRWHHRRMAEVIVRTNCGAVVSVSVIRHRSSSSTFAETVRSVIYSSLFSAVLTLTNSAGIGGAFTGKQGSISGSGLLAASIATRKKTSTEGGVNPF